MRNSVKVFAEAMERTLKDNDFKGGWDSDSIDWLGDRLVEEVGEYLEIATEGNYEDGVLAQKELTDIANFCMMIWDKIERLK